jgi:methyl-accepting chemotaxis protein
VRDGEAGKSGAHIVANYRGIPVLSVYAPVDFGGQPFVLLAEIDKAEVLAETKPWLVYAAAAVSGLAAGADRAAVVPHFCAGALRAA